MTAHTKRNNARLTGTTQAQNFYSKLLPVDSDTRKRLDEIYSRSPVELTSLYEEIATTKMAAEDGLKLFDQANNLEALKDQIAAKSMAYSMLHKCFTQIGRLAETASRIDQYNRTASAIHIARIIIEEAVQIANSRFGPHVPDEVIDDFKNKLYAAFEVEDPTVMTPRRNYPEQTGELDLMDQFTGADNE